MSTTSLPLSTILNVATVVSPAAAPGPSFNQALIVGPSSVIPSVGDNSRLRLYFSTSAMLEDGFTDADPEFLAAELYFGQTPAPTYLWVGRQDLTSINTIAIGTAASAIATATVGSSGGTGYSVGDIVDVTQAGASGGQLRVATVSTGGVVTGVALVPGHGGTGYSVATDLATTSTSGTGLVVDVTGVGTSAGGYDYVVGDIITVVQAGASGGQIRVTTIGTGGVVTGIELIAGAQGTGYSVATNLATTGGSGTGLLVSISAIGETPAQSVEACRIASPQWYCCMFVGTAMDSDHLAIAAFIEGAQPASVYFLTSGSTDILNNVSGNLFADLKAAKYRRTFSVYSTTQGGVFPNNAYASAAPMGIAMGRNTGAVGSYFDIMFKAIAGVAAEPLTQTQVNLIGGTVDRASTGLNGNLVLSYANGAYTWLQVALMASGDFFDEVMNLDMVAADMQTSGVNLLTSVPALPITDAGVLMMKNVLMGACLRAQARGFIAPSGTWQGVAVGSGNGAINSGDPLPNGFFLYAPPVSSMAPAQRAARVMPPITVLLIEAQSGHSLQVTVEVQK